MLFNFLSVILIWFFSSLVVSIFIIRDEDPKDINKKFSAYVQGSGAIGVIITLIFMWVMSWQNWWR